MTPARRDLAELARMQAARRQTQHQLVLIERHIARGVRHCGPGACMRRIRERLVLLTRVRQPEIDALSRQLARQDRAIAAFLARRGLDAQAA